MTKTQAAKNAEEMATRERQREKNNLKTALLPTKVQERKSNARVVGGEGALIVLTVNIWELKVSFVLQKIPLTMGRQRVG